MSSSPTRWYLKAQIGVLLLPVGLCLFGEAVSRRIVQLLGQDGGPGSGRAPQPDLHQRRHRTDDRQRNESWISWSAAIVLIERQRLTNSGRHGVKTGCLTSPIGGSRA